MELYQNPLPPQYSAEKINKPVGLFVGTLDKLANTIDATRWYSDMTNSTTKILHYYDIGHATFLYGKRLPYLEDLLNFLELD